MFRAISRGADWACRVSYPVFPNCPEMRGCRDASKLDPLMFY